MRLVVLIPVRTFSLFEVQHIFFSTDLYVEKLLYCVLLLLLGLPVGMPPLTSTKNRAPDKSSKYFPVTIFPPQLRQHAWEWSSRNGGHCSLQRLSIWGTTRWGPQTWCSSCCISSLICVLCVEESGRHAWCSSFLTLGEIWEGLRQSLLSQRSKGRIDKY